MKKTLLSILAIIAFQFSVTVSAQDEDAEPVTLRIEPRKPTTDDPNKWMVSIDGNTKVGYKEMSAYGECAKDFKEIESEARRSRVIADYLFLTEADSMDQLFSIMKDKTCELHKEHLDGKMSTFIELTAKEKTVFNNPIFKEELSKCLGKHLSTEVRFFFTRYCRGTGNKPAAAADDDE